MVPPEQKLPDGIMVLIWPDGDTVIAQPSTNMAPANVGSRRQVDSSVGCRVRLCDTSETNMASNIMVAEGNDSARVLSMLDGESFREQSGGPL